MTALPVALPEAVRPFSNGSEAEYWRFGNCDRCQLNTYRIPGDASCPMEEAIAKGSILGTVPTALAAEYGATNRVHENKGYCDMPTQCPKFVPPLACEYIVDRRKRTKPKCGQPAVGETEVRGYRFAVCAKHAERAP